MAGGEGFELIEGRGRFETGVLIGAGSSGEVYRAFDQQAQRWVALKFLRSSEPRLVQRLLREARAQAQVTHPSVCRVYDVGKLEGRYFVSMQLIQGHPLDEVLEKLSLRQRLDLLCHVAEAVREANDRGLIHRDLKPGNVLIEFTARGPRAFITDFGTVHEEGAPRLTRAGEIMGTPSFMAPEQARGGGAPINAATDVYGLGATLFYALTGRPPFERDTVLETLIDVTQRRAPTLREIDPRLPRALERVIRRCLEKDPRNRYPDVGALVHDLRRVSTDAEPARIARWRWVTAAGVFSLIGLLASSGFGAGAPAPLCVSVPGIVSWWDGDAVLGRNVADLAKLAGGVMSGDVDLDEGVVGTAFRFRGAGVVTFDSQIPRNQLSVEAWINPRVIERPWQRVVSKQRDEETATSAFILGLSGRGGVYFGLFKGDQQMFVETRARVPVEKWSHLAGVWDGQRMTVYLNGVLQPEVALFAGPMNFSDEPVRVGRGDTLKYAFTGRIDEVSIFARELSAKEVQAIFAAGKAGKCKVAP